MRKRAIHQKAAFQLRPIPTGHPPAWREEEAQLLSTYCEAALIGLIASEAKVTLDKNNLAPH